MPILPIPATLDPPERRLLWTWLVRIGAAAPESEVRRPDWLPGRQAEMVSLEEILKEETGVYSSPPSRLEVEHVELTCRTSDGMIRSRWSRRDGAPVARRRSLYRWRDLITVSRLIATAEARRESQDRIPAAAKELMAGCAETLLTWLGELSNAEAAAEAAADDAYAAADAEAAAEAATAEKEDV
jgi:hypothetical protein